MRAIGMILSVSVAANAAAIPDIDMAVRTL